MKDFVRQLKNAMYARLKKLPPEDNVQSLIQSLRIVNETIGELKAFIVNYTFTTKEEEISFFKFLKPELYSELLFYKKLLDIIINLPVSTQERKGYYESELNRISDFLDRKRQWLVYYRTESTYLDDKYFQRSGNGSDPVSSRHTLTSDTRFCTVGSIIFSRIRSSILLIQELEKRLFALTITDKSIKQLKWKGPKVGLVEMGYALKEAGALEESLQEIFEGFEVFFGVKLENTSRTFQEILSRKKEENVFLDKLSAKLKLRMDKINENYKPHR